MVGHETSAGMLNPIRQVGELTHRFQKKLCRLYQHGQVEDFHAVLDQDHIDVYIGVPNKAVSGLPGVSFVVAKRACISTLQEVG
jgi:2-aminoethylphosphonate-pyruvate transaminase